MHTLKVHSNIDVTQVEHSCEIDDVIQFVHFNFLGLDVC